MISSADHGYNDLHYTYIINLRNKKFSFELLKVYLNRDRNKRFSLKFVPCTDIYGHFHLPTQINDLLGRSWIQWIDTMDGYKEGLEEYNFKRICEAFFIVRLTHQQQRSRLRETTCPFRDLVLGWPIPASILTSVFAYLPFGL